MGKSKLEKEMGSKLWANLGKDKKITVSVFCEEVGSFHIKDNWMRNH